MMPSLKTLNHWVELGVKSGIKDKEENSLN